MGAAPEMKKVSVWVQDSSATPVSWGDQGSGLVFEYMGLVTMSLRMRREAALLYAQRSVI